MTTTTIELTRQYPYAAVGILLGVSERRVSQLCREQQLKSHLLGARFHYVLGSDIKAYLERKANGYDFK